MAAAVAEAAAAAVAAVHRPGAGPSQLNAAREAYEAASAHPQAHEVAMLLADAQRPPEVQHLGFQVLAAALRARPPAAGQRAELRRWLEGMLLPERWPAADAAYVQGKYAEALAALARLDWPKEWPTLKPALLAAATAPAASLAALALGAWGQLAEAVGEESQLPLPRRREMKAALAALAEQPAEAPDLFVALQKALQQHGGNAAVVREALGVCRSFVQVVPVATLLQHGLDKVVKVGLELERHRAAAVAALADWVERVCPKTQGTAQPAEHDLARFAGLLGRLAASCRFNGEQQTYAFHKQVGELFVDFCNSNAASLASTLGSAELAELWRAQLHLLRYPSVALQHEVLGSMAALAKAQGGAARPPLRELLGVFFLVSVRKDVLPLDSLEPERSEWLLRALGPPSTAEPLASFKAWSDCVEQCFAFDIRSGASGEDERSFHSGQVRVRVKELLCGESTEGFAALCQLSAELVLRALSKGWVPEFCAAAYLVENAAPAALRAAEKQGKEELDAVLAPSLAFLQQLTVEGAEGGEGSLEHRRLEFLGTWAPFYRHFGSEVVGQVLQRIVAVAERPAEGADVALRTRALDTLIAIGRSGSLAPKQLEALNAECGRLAPLLPPAARGKLLEALAAAVIGSRDLLPAQQAELIWGIMEQATTAFCALDITKSSAALAATLAEAASTPGGVVTAAGGQDSPAFLKLRELRTLLNVYTGVMSRSAGAERGEAAAKEGSGRYVVSKVVQAWAPGIFALLSSLAGLTAAAAAAGGAAATVVTMPCDQELLAMQGTKAEDMPQEAMAGLEPRKVAAVRSILWELQGAAGKAARGCLVCPDLWSLPDACLWLQGIAEALGSVRPHIADALLKDLFGPCFGRGGMNKAWSGPTEESAQGRLCGTVTSPLAAALTRALGSWWAVAGAAQPHALLAPAPLEGALAASSVALARTASLLLADMAGAGQSNAGQLAAPEAKLFLNGGKRKQEAPEPSGKRRKKNANKNRFAALEEDEDAAAKAAVDAAMSSASTLPALPGIAAVLLRDTGARDAVRLALLGLLELPEKDTVQRALVGLSVWTAQVWNLVCRGEHSEASGLARREDKPLEPGELLHAAGDALRVASTGVLKPVVQLVTTPPALPSAAPAGRAPLACSASLAARLQTSWQAYSSPGMAHGKPVPSGLVCDATQVLMQVLTVLVKVFRIQCRKVDLKCVLEQVYLCPALFECAQIFRGMPNTSEADVEAVMKAFVEDSDATYESQRALVRALLHEASPALARPSE